MSTSLNADDSNGAIRAKEVPVGFIIYTELTLTCSDSKETVLRCQSFSQIVAVHNLSAVKERKEISVHTTWMKCEIARFNVTSVFFKVPLAAVFVYPSLLAD